MRTAMGVALLVMDVQQGTVERFGDEVLLDRLARAVAAARGARIPVVFVRVAFRPGFPEVSANNRTFSLLVETAGDAFGVDSPGTRIHPAVAPLPGEPVVLKKRVSAFVGSDLDVVLRSLGVSHLVLTGIATSGVVLSTLREAADRDFQLTVLADACADGDAEVHRVLTEKVFPRQADVVSVAQWVDDLAAHR
ncbi:nicotinamidase-related amidase [Streptacidiphilus sp. BW17]